LGAPLLFGLCEEVDEGVAVGVSLGLGVAVSSGVAVAEADGDGDALGLGLGKVFIPFDFGDAVALGEVVGDALLCFGDAVGDGVGVDFLAGCFRCFGAGVGVGVASKKFLIFVPNDPSAVAVSIARNEIATTRRMRNFALIAKAKS
jgi:hypothetical protein